MDWPITLALGGVRVQVPAEDLDRARGVVLRVESGVYASELADQFGDLGEPRCPACDSGDFRTSCTTRTCDPGANLP
jgi:hypothetical protein